MERKIRKKKREEKKKKGIYLLSSSLDATGLPVRLKRVSDKEEKRSVTGGCAGQGWDSEKISSPRIVCSFSSSNCLSRGGERNLKNKK
jgi:hypothetical protein